MDKSPGTPPISNFQLRFSSLDLGDAPRSNWEIFSSDIRSYGALFLTLRFLRHCTAY